MIQGHLLELKLAAVSALTYEEFWGGSLSKICANNHLYHVYSHVRRRTHSQFRGNSRHQVIPFPVLRVSLALRCIPRRRVSHNPGRPAHISSGVPMQARFVPASTCVDILGTLCASLSGLSFLAAYESGYSEWLKLKA